MSGKVINGKELAYNLRMEMKKDVMELISNGITPHLTVILVGNNPASKSYVNGKKKASSETGISSTILELPSEITEEDLLIKIEELNLDDTVHGILVQLPLPDHIKEERIIEKINPAKDVDGFHLLNIGRMMIGEDTFIPCTQFGIMTMLQSKKIKIKSN